MTNLAGSQSNRPTIGGSISTAEDCAPGPFPSYKMSKVALNMLTVQYAFKYGKDGFAVYAISPGVRIAACPSDGNTEWRASAKVFSCINIPPHNLV